MSRKLILFVSITVSCHGQSKSEKNQDWGKQKLQIEESTRKLLTEFLVNENMEQLGNMLDDSIKFHWPDKTILGKEELMEACTNLVEKHDNQLEIFDS